MTPETIRAAAAIMAEATSWFVQEDYATEGLEALVARGWTITPPPPPAPTRPAIPGQLTIDTDPC